MEVRGSWLYFIFAWFGRIHERERESYAGEEDVSIHVGMRRL